MITVITGPGCHKCVATKRELETAGLPYRELPVTDPDAEAVIAATGYRMLPIVVDGEITWCDLRPDLIKAAAERAASPALASAA